MRVMTRLLSPLTERENDLGEGFTCSVKKKKSSPTAKGSCEEACANLGPRGSTAEGHYKHESVMPTGRMSTWGTNGPP